MLHMLERAAYSLGFDPFEYSMLKKLITSFSLNKSHFQSLEDRAM
jgi:hypothetical protein